MRTLTMPAGDLGGMDPSHAGGLFGWIGGAITAGLGAFGIWLANRTLGRAAFQTAINDGFKKLIDELQEQNAALKKASDAREEFWIAREIAWAAKTASLDGEIRNLNQRIESLTRQLERQGVAVESRSRSEPEPGATIIGKDQP